MRVCSASKVQDVGPASQEFHKKSIKSLHGLKKVIQIQDDILVYAKTKAEHLEI